MKKSAIVLFFTTLWSVAALAQNIQEGVNHLYAERYQSAKATFDKMVASNPNNIEANYWLGQTLLKMKDTAAAAAQYQKLLAANGNAPLALVGMGQVELMQGKTAEAKQRFESAITMSKGKKGNDPNVLLAVGRANTDAKGGDIAYALQRLNEAAQLAPNNAEVFVALGNAYRKMQGSGSQAATNFIKAGGINAKFAYPWYRLAKLYSTQQNWDVVVENLNKAIAADPNFAPAYLDLYYYYLLYPKDFAKAEEYANKYIQATDKSVENDYIKAQTAFVQNKFDDAINTAKNIVTQVGEKANPRVYRLLGYSFVGKGDSTTACQYVDQFFAKADSEDVIGADYILQADACGKDNPDVVRNSYLKAAKMDSVLGNQVKILNQGIDRFKTSGNKIAEADLRLLSYQLRGTQANPAELFQIGLPYYQGRQFQKADSVFSAYATALPDSIYGHYWSALSRYQQDTAWETGAAVPAYLKTLEVAERDKVRFKSQGVAASGVLGTYYNNIKKDKDSAIVYLKKGLEFDPTNTALQNAVKALSAAPAKTSTSSNAAKDGEATKPKTTKSAATKPTTKKSQ